MEDTKKKGTARSILSDPSKPTIIFPLVTAQKVNLAEIEKLSDLFSRIQPDGAAAHCCKHTWER